MRVLFSVVAKFSGVLDDQYWPCETTLQDAINACENAFGCDVEPSEEGDSEYSYLARESDDEFWSKLQDIEISGVLNRDQLKTFLNNLGGWINNEQTMGTLGGPLGIGIVPDLDVTIESRCLISCIRVTPFPDSDDYELTEERWNRICNVVRKEFGL